MSWCCIRGSSGDSQARSLALSSTPTKVIHGIERVIGIEKVVVSIEEVVVAIEGGANFLDARLPHFQLFLVFGRV